MQLYTKHAPRTWADIVGQDRAVKRVRAIAEREGFDRGAFWIDAAGTNNSGLGKSTIARVLANTLADDFFVQELDGARLDKRAVQELQDTACVRTWSSDKPYRVWIVNEAHAITAGALDLLLTFLEALPPHCVIVFTTTKRPDVDLFGDDDGPLMSRCFHITLTNQGLAKAFATRAREIARSENLDGKPESAYVRLVQGCKNNMRAVLQRIEAGEMLD